MPEITDPYYEVTHTDRNGEIQTEKIVADNSYISKDGKSASFTYMGETVRFVSGLLDFKKFYPDER